MDDSLQKRLGTKVRSLRKAKGLSIGKVADVADLDVSFLGQIELGKRDPSLSSLVKIAKGLGVPVAEFFSDMKPSKISIDEKIIQEIGIVVHGRTESQKDDILAILKQLHDLEQVKALRRIIRR